MKLIVGLGNPGDEYKHTRHNIGFLVIDELAKRWDLTFKSEPSALYATAHINGEKVIVAKPNLYMNNSGRVIKGMADYFKLDIEDILVIQDDKDQEMATYKIVNSGGHGGQNGVRDIISHFGSNDILRIKAGIGNPGRKDTADYVLSKWNEEQRKVLPSFIKRIADIAEDSINCSFVELANKYNGK